MNAVAAVGSPSPGEIAQLERVRQAISDGHTHLIARDDAGATDLFKDAVARALSLLLLLKTEQQNESALSFSIQTADMGTCPILFPIRGNARGMPTSRRR